jgi:BirA family biotin operon repressor/biotin-[acetyl-CoA-carboxylase] ligase
VSFESALRQLADGNQRSCRELKLNELQLEEFLCWLDELGLEFDVESLESADRSISIPKGLDLLDAETIRDLMSGETNALLQDIEVFLQIDSTNTYLFNKKSSGKAGLLCLAETQSAGRGRRGRTWVSPFATNLYLSIGWRMPMSKAPLEGLSLAVGVAVVRALNHEGFSGIEMKWPNDLLIKGGKLAGILIEMKAPKADCVDLVIGVGINLNMPVTSSKLIDQPWQDLSHGMESKTRNRIAASVISSLVRVLVEYPGVGFRQFRDEWHALDAYYNKLVELHLGDKIVKGVAQGVTGEGAIKILVDGELQNFHGGEISLRLADDS